MCFTITDITSKFACFYVKALNREFLVGHLFSLSPRLLILFWFLKAAFQTKGLHEIFPFVAVHNLRQKTQQPLGVDRVDR